MPTRPAFSPDWSEGRYFDRWMLVHAVSGMAGGLSNAFFDLTPLGVTALAFLLMVAWEGAEVVAGVGEAWSNRVFDVIIGMVGAWISIPVLAATPVAWRVPLFWATFAVSVAGSYAGWLAFRRRADG